MCEYVFQHLINSRGYFAFNACIKNKRGHLKIISWQKVFLTLLGSNLCKSVTKKKRFSNTLCKITVHHFSFWNMYSLISKVKLPYACQNIPVMCSHLQTIFPNTRLYRFDRVLYVNTNLFRLNGHQHKNGYRKVLNIKLAWEQFIDFFLWNLLVKKLPLFNFARHYNSTQEKCNFIT